MTNLKMSAAGRKLLCEFEGFKAQAYRDPVGILTIGYGFTDNVKIGDVITQEQANIRLKNELIEYEQAVLLACKIAPNQHQFDALVSFAWNVGTAGMARSSVIKAHNRGDYQSAARAFALWNKAGGRVFAGLTRRRAAEAALYLKPEFEEATVQAYTLPAMPQAIEPEREMSESGITRAGVAAGGTAAVATVAETVRTVADIKHSAATLQDWLLPILLIVIVALAVYIVWQRYKQRKDGWA